MMGSTPAPIGNENTANQAAAPEKAPLLQSPVNDMQGRINRFKNQLNAAQQRSSIYTGTTGRSTPSAPRTQDPGAYWDRKNHIGYRRLLDYMTSHKIEIPEELQTYKRSTDYRNELRVYETLTQKKQDNKIDNLVNQYRQKHRDGILNPDTDFEFSSNGFKAAKEAGLEALYVQALRRSQAQGEAVQKAKTDAYIAKRQVHFGDPSMTGGIPNGLRTQRRKEIVDAKVQAWQRERQADPTGKNLPPAQYGSTRYYDEQHARRMRQEFEFQDNRQASANRWYGQIREKMANPESYETGMNELVEFRRMNPNFAPKPGHPVPQFAKPKGDKIDYSDWSSNGGAAKPKPEKTDYSDWASGKSNNDPLDEKYAKISKLMSDPRTYDQGVDESMKFWNENPTYTPKATASNSSTSVSNGNAVAPGSTPAPQTAGSKKAEPPKVAPPAVKQPEPPKAATQPKQPIPVEQSGFNRNPLPNPKNNPDIKEYNDLLTRIKEEAKTRQWPDAEVLPDGTIHLHEGSSNVHNSNSNVDPIPYAPGHYGFGGFGPKTAKAFVIDYYLRPDGTLQVIKTGVNDRWNLKSKEWRFEIQGNKLDRQEIVTPKGTNPPYVEHHRAIVIPATPAPRTPSGSDTDRFEPSSNLLIA